MHLIFFSLHFVFLPSTCCNITSNSPTKVINFFGVLFVIKILPSKPWKKMYGIKFSMLTTKHGLTQVIKSTANSFSSRPCFAVPSPLFSLWHGYTAQCAVERPINCKTNLNILFTIIIPNKSGICKQQQKQQQ